MRGIVVRFSKLFLKNVRLIFILAECRIQTVVAQRVREECDRYTKKTKGWPNFVKIIQILAVFSSISYHKCNAIILCRHNLLWSLLLILMGQLFHPLFLTVLFSR